MKCPYFLTTKTINFEIVNKEYNSCRKKNKLFQNNGDIIKLANFLHHFFNISMKST